MVNADAVTVTLEKDDVTGTALPRGRAQLFGPCAMGSKILILYRVTRFSSVAGELTSNRLLSIIEGLDTLPSAREGHLRYGSRAICFEEVQAA